MKGNEQIELKAQRYLYERAHLSESCVVTTFDPFDLEQAFIDGAEWQYEQFEKVIDTLEVKEVNLEKEVRKFIKNNGTSLEEPDEFLTTLMQLDDMVMFAKHFYELGIKTKKGE